jgi:hypothetical protein
MTLRSQFIIGLIAIASFPIISSGADTTSINPPRRIYTQTEIPYVQRLNCDTFADIAAK